MTSAERAAAVYLAALGLGYAAASVSARFGLLLLYAVVVVPLSLGVVAATWPRRALTFWALCCGPILVIPAGFGLWINRSVSDAVLSVVVAGVGLGWTVFCGLLSHLAQAGVRAETSEESSHGADGP